MFFENVFQKSFFKNFSVSGQGLDWVHMVLKKQKVLILAPSSLIICQDQLPTCFQRFSKTAKKVPEWYLAVKCEKANKWIRFLSVKTFSCEEKETMYTAR